MKKLYTLALLGGLIIVTLPGCWWRRSCCEKTECGEMRDCSKCTNEECRKNKCRNCKCKDCGCKKTYEQDEMVYREDKA